MQAKQGEGYSCNAFFLLSEQNKKYIARNQKFPFIYLSKTLLKTTPNIIFCMNKFNQMDRN